MGASKPPSGHVVPLAGVFQRRRSAEDELAMRGFLQEGDLISVSCGAGAWVRGRGVPRPVPALLARHPGLGRRHWGP